MSSLLSEFALVALGYARDMASPIAGPDTMAWADAALLRFPALLASPALARTEPLPSPEQLAALEFVVKQKVLAAAEAYAFQRVYPSMHQPNAVVIRGGSVKHRMIWLENGLIKTAVKKDARLNPRATYRPDAPGDIQVFTMGASPLDAHRVHPELNQRVDTHLGFSRAGLPESVSHLAQILGTDNTFPQGTEAIIQTMSRALDASSSELELIRAASTAAARLAARTLFPLRAKGPQAARFWISGPQLGHAGQISDLGSGVFSEQALSAAEQTPETMALCSAFAPALGLGPLGSDAAGRVKRILGERFALTTAGWKGLVALAIKRPRLVFELGALFPAPNPARAAPAFTSGYARALSDGTPISTHRQVRLLEVCMIASLCATGGIDFELAFDAMFPQLHLGSRHGPKVELDSFSSLLSLSPQDWRQVMGHDSDFVCKPWLTQSWTDVCQRHGVLGETELSPQGFTKLALAGWTPSGDQELMMAGFERDRYARETKGPSMVQSLLSRLRVLGSSSEKLEREASSVVDFLFHLELGFWELAPQKIEWSWLKERARIWHDCMDQQKASQTSWAPAQSQADSDGWFDLGSGWRARELTHGGALHDEGRTMRHCVSLYAERCLLGQCRIFSLRSTEGSGKSTLELQVERDTSGAEIRLKIAQHRGFANSDPPLLAKLTAQRVEQRMNTHLSEMLRSKLAAPSA